MKIIFRYFFFLYVFILGSKAAEAQGSMLTFDKISTQHGLSQSVVTCIFQDSRGFMWFGTQEGLNLYDGHQFIVFSKDSTRTGAISGNHIKTIYEDRQGTLWIGVEDGGLNRFDRNQRSFITFKHDPRQSRSLSHNTVTSVFEDRAGNLWIGTEKGLNLFDRPSMSFTRYYSNEDDPATLSHNDIHCIIEDDKNRLWVGTASGVSIMDKERKQFSRLLHAHGDAKTLSSEVVTCIYQDRKRRMWVGTEIGLNKYVPQDQSFIHYFHDPADLRSLSSDEIHAICEDKWGELCIATFGGGLNKLDKSGKFIKYQHKPADPASLSNNYVVSLFTDASGLLWIGTYGNGLNKAFYSGQTFQHLDQRSETKTSLSSNEIFAVYEDRNDVLWIGTEKGLNAYNKTDQDFKVFLNQPSDPSSLSNDEVYAVLEDKQGRLWIGTSGGGLNQLIRRKDKAKPTFRRLMHNPASKNSLSDNQVLCLYEDRNQRLWVGTSNGANVLSEDRTEITRYSGSADNPAGLSNNYVQSVVQDSKGVVWIGTQDGLNRWNESLDNFTHYKNVPYDTTSISNNVIYCIYEDSRGILWVGTEGGLNALDPARNQFTRYTKKDGLPDNLIYGILEDSEGNLWLSTDKGLSKCIVGNMSNKHEVVFNNYTTANGLHSNTFNIGAYGQGADGILYFGGNDGVAYFHPNRIKGNTYKPPVVITAFNLFFEPVKISASGESPLNKHISETREITLTHDQNVLQFEFAALSFIRSSENKYAYKLENFDKEWRYPTDLHSATYTNLDPGTYTFWVKAANCDGVWNETGTKLIIHIRPPFYRTPWFLTLCAFSMVGGVYGFVRYRTDQFRRTQLILESRVRSRTAEVVAQKNEIERKNQTLHIAYEQIEKQKENIESSIKYAKRIQDAMLPSLREIQEALPESFIFFKPRDIVSGDFYWFANRHDKIIITAVDCTGHGVPGAFMSLIGNDILTENIVFKDIISPDQILQRLHIGVRKALKQENTLNQDGMDMSLCSIDKKNRVVEFAGAKNPLFMIRNNAEGVPELEVIRGDKMPIGGVQEEAERVFTKHTFELGTEPAVFYLFSDGYQDQFGGEKGRKFMVKQFKELLLSIHHKPMQEQKQILETTLIEWMGETHEQIDDVLVIGFRI